MLVRPERNGYVYVLDRATGEVLSAEPFAPVTATTGRRPRRPARLIQNAGQAAAGRQGGPRHLPDGAGRQGLEPVGVLAADRAALHPAQQPVHGLGERRGELHRRHALCRRRSAHEARARAGNRGAFTAWDIAGRQAGLGDQGKLPGLERRASRPPATSSSTAPWRAGSRRSNARPARCCGSSRRAPGSSASRRPIAARTGSSTSRSSSGVGGWAGAVVSGDLDPRDGTAALGFVNAMRDLKDVTTKGGTLYVFRLP